MNRFKISLLTLIFILSGCATSSSHPPPSCDVYSVGGELLDSSEWTCMNGANIYGDDKTAICFSIPEEDALSPEQKRFTGEHYTCYEEE